MRRLLIIPFLLLVLSTTLQAQTVIYGRVLEEGTDHAIPESQIHIPGSNIATSTNDDGRFILTVDSLPSALEVSAIGYRNGYVRGSKIKESLTHEKGSRNRELRITLSPSVTILNDVLIYSPENILRTAIEKIKENNRLLPETYEAFYRETIRKRKTYVGVNEAVVNMYKSSYENGPEYDQIHLQKGRSLVSQRKKDSLSVHIKGGPTEALYLDLVKNRGFMFDTEHLKLYRLDVEQPMSINNRPQYVISFKPIGVTDEVLYQGLIYIDHATLSFTRIEFEMDMSNPDKVSSIMLARKPLGMRFKPKSLKTVVNYYNDGHFSDFAYIRTTYNFNCDWKKRGMAISYEAVSEMVVTNHSATIEHPRRRDSFSRFDVLGKKVMDFEDPDFWKDYNILQPSESLEHAVEKLKKNNNN